MQVKEELDNLKSKIATPAESSDPSSTLSPESLRTGRLERIESSLSHKSVVSRLNIHSLIARSQLIIAVFIRSATIDSMISEVSSLSRQLDSLQVEDN